MILIGSCSFRSTMKWRRESTWLSNMITKMTHGKWGAVRGAVELFFRFSWLIGWQNLKMIQLNLELCRVGLVKISVRWSTSSKRSLLYEVSTMITVWVGEIESINYFSLSSLSGWITIEVLAKLSKLIVLFLLNLFVFLKLYCFDVEVTKRNEN